MRSIVVSSSLSTSVLSDVTSEEAISSLAAAQLARP